MPHITVVFPSFTRAEPSAVVIEPETRRKKNVLQMLRQDENALHRRGQKPHCFSRNTGHRLDFFNNSARNHKKVVKDQTQNRDSWLYFILYKQITAQWSGCIKGFWREVISASCLLLLAAPPKCSLKAPDKNAPPPCPYGNSTINPRALLSQSPISHLHL